MAFVVFALSLVLVLAGLSSGYASLDLLPTPLGVLYALAGAVAASIAVLAFALGVAIRRIDALAALMRPSAPLPAALAPDSETAAIAAPPEKQALDHAIAGETAADQPFIAHPSPGPAEGEAWPAPAAAAAEERAREEAAEHPINENRAGRLPTLGEVEPEPAPDGPPALVGRYASGGANYMIFSDGSIEAETAEGTFKFASMGDFKHFIAARREGQPL